MCQKVNRWNESIKQRKIQRNSKNGRNSMQTEERYQSSQKWLQIVETDLGPSQLANIAKYI